MVISFHTLGSRIDTVISAQNGSAGCAMIRPFRLTPACFAGDGWRPNAGLFSDPSWFKTMRVSTASNVFDAASAVTPSKNTLLCAAGFGLGASGLITLAPASTVCARAAPTMSKRNVQKTCNETRRR
jgi:hypothetical protein